MLPPPPTSTLFPYTTLFRSGANSWQRIRHITLPGMMPVISMLLILNVGTALTVGFEQLLLQQRSEEHTSELQSRGHLVCRLLLEKKKKDKTRPIRVNIIQKR